MKRKHLEPEKETSSPEAVPRKVIDVDQSEKEEEGKATGPKPSWLWGFMKASNELGIVVSPGMILRHLLTGAIAELIPLLWFELC